MHSFSSKVLMAVVSVGLAVCGMLVLGSGCPPPDGNGQVDNQAPIANAGTNQTVNIGDNVTLNGSNSSDADGDVLTFNWTQTAGTAVALAGANSAAPSFTAPNAATTLTFQLTVSDGQASDADSVNVGVNQQVQQDPVLFIANSNSDSVTSYAKPANVNGNIAPDTNLAGAQTQLDFPTGMAIEGNNALLVVSLFTQAITGYDDAVNTNGNLAPNRNVQGAATLIIQPREMTFDPVNDLVFLADNAANQVLVFNNASTAAFNGNTAPIRRIFTTTTADINQPRGVDLDTFGGLYVANRGGNNVLVFANAANLNGDVTPTRIITSAEFTDIRDLRIDGSGRLLVVDFVDNQVYTFNNAAALNGNVTPDFALTVNGAAQLRAIEVDSSGVGYLADAGNNAVFSYDSIATLNGALNPDRTIQGAATQLDNPRALVLLE